MERDVLGIFYFYTVSFSGINRVAGHGSGAIHRRDETEAEGKGG